MRVMLKKFLSFTLAGVLFLSMFSSSVTAGAAKVGEGEDISVKDSLEVKDSDGIGLPDERGSDIYHERYISVTPLAGNDVTLRSHVQSMVDSMGYGPAELNMASALNIYNNLPYNHISIIHGHGTAGYVQCETAAGLTYLYSYPRTPSQLRANDATMMNYANGALNRHKLVVFITCQGASSLNGYSMASAAYNKGAACSIGFAKDVAGGGEWLDLFIYHLSLKENIGTAIDNANNDLREIYPSIANGPDSPTLAGSLMRWGDRYATISLT